MADKPSETPLIRALEPRLMYDAAAGETHAELSAQQIAQQQTDKVLPSADELPTAKPSADGATPTAAINATNLNNASAPIEKPDFAAADLPGATNSANNLSIIAAALAEHSITSQTGPEFVFVDTSVPDYQQLLAGINPTAQVVFLDSHQDGVSQIQASLAGQQNVAAIYLISHGAAGEIELGSALINSQTISTQYAENLQIIGQSLAKNADILIYGCDFAAGASGLQAVNELAALTGARIAASNDNTGAAAQGGDWNLEVQTGAIDAAPVLNPQALAEYPYLLDLPAPLSITQSFNEETQASVTGPHYLRELTNTVQIANGQTINNFTLSQNLPDNIIVTAIKPDSGGVVSSLTLENGKLVTDSAEISSTLTAGAFLKAYTVEYAILNTTKATAVEFYVPEFDANGAAVIDPNTGAAVTINLAPANGSGIWSTTNIPAVDNFQVSSNSTSFTAKAIALQDNITILHDTGATGLTPGDTLQHNLQVNVSDYFSFGALADNGGQWLVNVVLNEGQTFNAAAIPTLHYTDDNGTHSVILQRGVSFLVGNTPGDDSGTKNANGQTYISINPATIFGHLSGDDVLGGNGHLLYAAQVFITLQSTVDNTYAHGELITEGDSISDQASLTASLLDKRLQLTDYSDTDNSSASLTVPSGSVTSTIVANNGILGSPTTLKAGDSVTIELTYQLTTGNFFDFSLQSFLPLPVLKAGDPAANGANSNWSSATGPGLPAVGQWKLSSADTVGIRPSVTVDSTANSLTFNFGNNQIAAQGPQTISVLYTLKLTGQPVSDNLALSILTQSYQIAGKTSPPISLESNSLLQINLSEPQLQINTGVVSVSNGKAVISGATGAWLTTDNLSSTPFTGIISNSNAVSGSLNNFQASDILRLATGIENTGGAKAYGIMIDIGALPKDLAYLGGSLETANLKVVKGDGTVLARDKDYSVSGDYITMQANTDAASLAAGRNGTTQITDGSNILIITYDTVALNTLAATTTMSTSASLIQYTSQPDSPNFLTNNINVSATEISASPTATMQVFNPTDTLISPNDMVIGESALYVIKVTLPEGVTNNLSFTPNLPTGFMLDSSYGDFGYKVFTTKADAEAEAAGLGKLLAADFNINSDNNPNNNSYLVVIKVIVADTNSNRAGESKAINLTLGWENGNGGVSSVDTNTITETILEPSLTLTETVIDPAAPPSVANTAPISLINAGDPLQYTITISNPNGVNSVNAFDLLFADNFAGQFHALTILSAELGLTGFKPGSGVNILNQFEISGTTVQTLGGLSGGKAAPDLTLAPGQSIVLVVNAISNNISTPLAVLSSNAQVQWSSADTRLLTQEQAANVRTGVDGVGDELNNYAATAIAQVTVQYFDHAPVGADKVIPLTSENTYSFNINDFGFRDPNNYPADGFAGVLISALPPASQGQLNLNGVAVFAGQFVPVTQINSLSFTPAVNASGSQIGAFSFQVRNDGSTVNGGQNTDPAPKTIAFDIAFINTAPPILDKPFVNNPDILENKFIGITLTGLPSIVEGVLNLNGSPVSVDQFIPLAQISGLSFSTVSGTKTASISYKAVTNDNGGETQKIQSLAFNLVSKAADGGQNSSHQFGPSDFGFTDPNDNPADVLGALVAATTTLGGLGSGAGAAAGSIGMSGGGGGGMFTVLAALSAAGGNLLRNFKPFVLPVLLIAGLIFAFCFNRIVITIQSGEAGILYHRFSGTDTDIIYPEGLHIISPWNIMYIYQVRKQVALHEFDVISNKGLTIHLALAVRYLPEYELLGILHQRIGPDYLQRVILPQIESVMRKSLGNYSAEQIYTNEEGLLTKTILTALDEVGRNYVHVEDIIIRSIVLPPDIISAIEDKLKQEEFLKSYEFRIKTADKEGERLKIEADAIKNYNKLVNDTLTPSNLMHKGIAATQTLADSPNPKVVIIGSGKNSMPLILGSDQAPPSPTAPAARKPDQIAKPEKTGGAHE